MPLEAIQGGYPYHDEAIRGSEYVHAVLAIHAA